MHAYTRTCPDEALSSTQGLLNNPIGGGSRDSSLSFSALDMLLHLVKGAPEPMLRSSSGDAGQTPQIRHRLSISLSGTDVHSLWAPPTYSDKSGLTAVPMAAFTPQETEPSQYIVISWPFTKEVCLSISTSLLHRYVCTHICTHVNICRYLAHMCTHA